jgi:hypothetical protein
MTNSGGCLDEKESLRPLDYRHSIGRSEVSDGGAVGSGVVSGAMVMTPEPSQGANANNKHRHILFHNLDNHENYLFYKQTFQIKK